MEGTQLCQQKNKLHELIFSLRENEPWVDIEKQNRDVSLDDMFSIISNQRRRYVIAYLIENGEIKLSRLATQIAAWENDTELSSIDSQERKRVYVSLYQNHLPKLDEQNIIEYDKRRGDIRPGKNIETAYRHMRFDINS